MKNRGLLFTSCSFLVGGQQFAVNELSDSVKMPQNVIAFINAWRQKRDVWHSPNNDPKFGVRVKDVSLYEYRVGKASAVKPAESVAAPAPAAAPAVEGRNPPNPLSRAYDEGGLRMNVSRLSAVLL